MKKDKLIGILSSNAITYYHDKKFETLVTQNSGKEINPEIIKQILEPYIENIRGEITEENVLLLVNDSFEKFLPIGKDWLNTNKHMHVEVTELNLLNKENAGALLTGYLNYCLMLVGVDLAMYYEDLIKEKQY